MIVKPTAVGDYMIRMSTLDQQTAGEFQKHPIVNESIVKQRRLEPIILLQFLTFSQKQNLEKTLTQGQCSMGFLTTVMPF